MVRRSDRTWIPARQPSLFDMPPGPAAGTMPSWEALPQHPARKAMLYVRQSASYQVLHNRESQALQYSMRDRLTQFGWSWAFFWVGIE